MLPSRLSWKQPPWKAGKGKAMDINSRYSKLKVQSRSSGSFVVASLRGTLFPHAVTTFRFLSILPIAHCVLVRNNLITSSNWSFLCAVIEMHKGVAWRTTDRLPADSVDSQSSVSVVDLPRQREWIYFYNAIQMGKSSVVCGPRCIHSRTCRQSVSQLDRREKHTQLQQKSQSVWETIYFFVGWRCTFPTHSHRREINNVLISLINALVKRNATLSSWFSSYK